ncbi:hypothetical protein [Bacillus cereus]|uniref:hypothetical protein n=1 Tax=Bacillus cereus TaxID=1396 RepID=UPI000BEDA1FB|nr:hypothetical protein [Bacillus cereus]PEF89797.1 hypothetical protein CON46_27240 [Bacillus cereus]
MFKTTTNDKPETKAEENTIKYENPKMLLVDLHEEAVDTLKKEGFNIEVGSFGSIYVSSYNKICELNGSLPFITESDLVIIQLDGSQQTIVNEPYLEDTVTKGNRKVFTTPRNQDYFDGRMAFSSINKNNFLQVMKNGGIIVTFADSKLSETYNLTEINDGYMEIPTKITSNNYDWTPVKISPKNCSVGKQIVFKEENKAIADLIFKGCENEIIYTSEFENIPEHEILLKNKSGNTISFIKEIHNGFLIVLPKFENYYKPISNLIRDVLPVIRPELFPDFVTDNWINNEEYIFPEIKNLVRSREVIKEKYEKELVENEVQIGEIKKKNEFLTNMLISQGYNDFLVDNIKQTLEYLGYTKVIDTDKIVEGNKQEDLRILDDNRFTVIEIKGHKGSPTEDDCQALLKYINRNMRSEKRTDIHGILIVNHQRIIPPLERKFPGYTPEQIIDAERDMYTLVTTWELFKSIRLYQEGLLTFKDIDQTLHTPGLFRSIPITWLYIGKIQHIFNRNQENNIICVILDCLEVKKGDQLIIEDGNDYFTQFVEEMRVENQEVDCARKGDKLAIKIQKPLSKQANIYVKQS